jgi:hypothetical protein
MPKINHISIEIDAAFGSPFQEESALRTLDKMMAEWIDFYGSKHSKNCFAVQTRRSESFVHRARTTRPRRVALPHS